MTVILVADSEDIVVKIAVSALEHAGDRVITASTGAKAFEAAARAQQINVLVLDCQVPRDWGRDIAKHLLAIHPEMKIMHTNPSNRAVAVECSAMRPSTSRNHANESSLLEIQT